MNLTEKQTHHCDCQLCKTTREMNRIANMLPKEERAWLLSYYEASFEAFAELDMIQASRN